MIVDFDELRQMGSPIPSAFKRYRGAVDLPMKVIQDEIKLVEGKGSTTVTVEYTGEGFKLISVE